MADVFVSYSRSNRDQVTGVSDALEASGYSVWWDRRLSPSDDYAMLIETEIDAAPSVVVAWSATARQSLWVRAEANEALDAGKLVQINLDGSRLPLPFTMLHFLDFSRWGGQRSNEPWGELDSRITALLRGEGAAEPAFAGGGGIVAGGAARGPALQGLGKTALLGWASILLVGLIAGAILMTVAGKLNASQFGSVALIGLALAALLLGATAFTLLRISMASRR
jgi:TIR domain